VSNSLRTSSLESRRDDFDGSGIWIPVKTFPSSLKAEEIPVFLAQKKAAAYTATIHQNELLVTADTVVWLENEVLNKPLTLQEAKAMLRNYVRNC
jgi:septum formation protein